MTTLYNMNVSQQLLYIPSVWDIGRTIYNINNYHVKLSGEWQWWLYI